MEWPILAIADADRIQDYVFATQELLLITGASSLQVRCTTEVSAKTRSAGGQVLRHDGGTVVALLRENGVAQFETNARNVYRARTHSATTTVVSVDNVPGKFGKCYKRLQSCLEERKNSQPESGFAGGSPFWAVCETCGTSPAAGLRESERVCQACLFRNRSGIAVRRDPLLRGAHELPLQFEWLGQQAKPENYIALVYLDCDRLGKFVSDRLTDNPRSLRTLSRSIALAMKGSIRSAIGSIESVLDNGTMFDPYRILLIGGDDAYIVLPANLAFGFVERFQEEFDKRQLSNGEAEFARPTFSAGIAIAHSHYPIGELVRIAGQLIRSAKNIDLKLKPDSLDYAIVTASMADDAAARLPGITGRPYPITEFRTFRRQLAALKATVPMNKLRALYPLSYESRLQGGIEYIDMLRRLKVCERLPLIRTVGQSLWSDARTLAADAAELLEFC
jgi:hypothetical protein